MREETQPSDGQFSECALPLRKLDPPTAGTAHLWYLDLARLGNPLDPAQTVERDRMTIIQRRTLRRFYLRLLLGAYLGRAGKDVQISRAVRGKPMLDPAVHPESLDFSMAASRGRCLIGVTSGASVGVDLEPRGRRAGRPLALAQRYFSSPEVTALEAVEPAELDAAFLRAWACKEAYVKAAGLGIANELRRFTVEVAPSRPVALLDLADDQADAWQLREVSPGPSMLGVVAVRSPALLLRCRHLVPPAVLAGA